MTTERDVNKLLGVILEKSRFVTGADAGSIYVVEHERRRAPSAGRGRSARASHFARADAPLQALAERLGALRLARVRDAALEPLDRRQRRAREEGDQHRRRLRDPRRRAVRLRSPLRREDRLPHEVDAHRPARLAARRGDRRHPADQQEEGSREEALHEGRHRGAGRPVRRAQRRAARHGRRAGRRLAREHDALRRDPAASSRAS